ncbi:MAG: hypothetical protein IPN22_15040 [Bacteroidetes bacterium]|nr:hypothetical protein [Bacteroidota bacterium]
MNPNPVCEGSSITLSATFGNGTPTDATYNWSGPNGFTSQPPAQRAATCR